MEDLLHLKVGNRYQKGEWISDHQKSFPSMLSDAPLEADGQDKMLGGLH